MNKAIPGLTIHLLGRPNVQRPRATAAQPRGNKVWGLLAYLVLSAGPPSRHRLAEMLFAEADDPLGALRWNIAELRRLLGPQATIAGDPVRLELPRGATTDTSVVLSGSWTDAVRMPGLGRTLLEGLHYESAPGFDLWLVGERARLAAAAEAILHEAAVANLAQAKPERALEYATRLLSLNQFDENAHALLARALMAAGDRKGAEHRVQVAVRLFREELGVEPSPAFRTAALAGAGTSILDASRSMVAAQLEAGQAAIAAGAWNTGIEALRRAAAAAEATADDRLLAEVQLNLGSALVHSARGFDEEGATSLHKASAFARKAGLAHVAANAKRELGWVELLRGRYERALHWLDEAEPLAAGHGAESAWIAALRGVCESDMADYPGARTHLQAAVRLAADAQAIAPGAFAHTFLGRLHLLREDTADARAHLERGIELARQGAWTAFVPLPLSLLAEVTLLCGEAAGAGAAFEHAFTLSCQLGDPCWESLGARGLGLVAARKGDTPAALARLGEAPRLCRRFPDSYLWIEAYALEALCRVALEAKAPDAPAMIAELESMAARTGMRELLARALLHRASLGDPSAGLVAESLVASIENPALARRLGSARG